MKFSNELVRLVIWMWWKIFTWRLMLSRLHGKQNLWWATDGHCTKWVSSKRSLQIVPKSHKNIKLAYCEWSEEMNDNDDNDDEYKWYIHFKVGLTGVAFGIRLASVGWPLTGGGLLGVFCCCCCCCCSCCCCCVLFDETLLLFDCDCASVDVTVVLETWRDPDDLLPLDEPTDDIY